MGDSGGVINVAAYSGFLVILTRFWFISARAKPSDMYIARKFSFLKIIYSTYFDLRMKDSTIFSISGFFMLRMPR